MSGLFSGFFFVLFFVLGRIPILSTYPLLCALLARLCRDHTGENDSRETKEGKDRYYVYLLTVALNMVLWSQNTDFYANSIMTFGNYLSAVSFCLTHFF